MRQIVLKHQKALGDTVLMTALVRDLQATYPNQFKIDIQSNWSRVWYNNPHIGEFMPKVFSRSDVVELSWKSAIYSHARVVEDGVERRRHILGWYHHAFEKQTGIRIRPLKPYADIHLTDSEKQPIVSGNYWVIVGGGKLDATVKHWHFDRIQEVVRRLKDRGIEVVQIGATHKNHIHPNLPDSLNMIGKTEDIRDLFSLIYNSQGVICGVTGPMHIAAAFQKPCVVFAGGREEVWFEAYTNDQDSFGTDCSPVPVEHRFLHSIGKLSCCLEHGCWRNRTVPIEEEDITLKPHGLCLQPKRLPDKTAIATCQDLITVDDVVSAVLSYNTPCADKPLEIMRPTAVTVQQPEFRTKFPQELFAVHGKAFAGTNVLDHPIIGGKLTVCVLCYGSYTDLAKKCLGSLFNTIPVTRLDVRVATNQASQETIDYLNLLPLRKLYVHPGNDFKYPVMREMFYDPECPIETKYLLWLDDDTYVVDPNWSRNLCELIVANHEQGYRMYGDLKYHNLANYGPTAGNWFKEASWYSGIPFRSTSRGPETPNGSVIDFAVGWCWAACVESLRIAGVPDIRLAHNGGDITIGEQMHQAGFNLMQWNRQKSQIACPTRENGGRRGFSQNFPWSSL